MTALPIEFDAEKHEYRVYGAVWPSVTQLIREAGLVDSFGHTDFRAARGSYIHACTAMDDRGELDFDAIEPEAKGYVEAWRAFRLLIEFSPTEIEKIVICESRRYCGTLDRIGTFGGSRDPWIVDIKCGAFAPWHFVQLAMYAACLPRPMRRAVVCLSDDGSFRMSADGDRKASDEAARAVASLAAWKRNHGR